MTADAQISVFSLLDEYETEHLPVEERHKGGHAWVIEYRGVHLLGSTEIVRVEARSRRVVFLDDIQMDPDGFKWEHAKTDDGKPFWGWLASPQELFRKRPTMSDVRTWIDKHSPEYAGKKLVDWEDVDD